MVVRFIITKIVIDPVTRISGLLKIEVDVENNKVVDARSSGSQFRGFEKIFVGREPLDIIRIAPKKLSLISHTPMSICGFKMREILSGILSIEDMINKGEYRCENLYKSVVCDRGSIGTEKIMNQVFTRCSNEWRGMGWIDDTGLKFKEEYNEFDAAHKFNIAVNDKSAVSGCICGEILRGAKRPDECKLFTKVCNPSHPIGPCMVSEEGTCRSFYYI